MTDCLFVSDLHGRVERYARLFEAIARERPEAVFMGGDLLPSALRPPSGDHLGEGDFVEGYLEAELSNLRASGNR